jgi:hypothetical protein
MCCIQSLGAAGRLACGQGAGADVDDDLVHLGVIGHGDLPGQERLSHRHQRIRQTRRRYGRRLVSAGVSAETPASSL